MSMKKSKRWFLWSFGIITAISIILIVIIIIKQHTEAVNIDPLPIYPNSDSIRHYGLTQAPDDVYATAHCSVTNVKNFDVFVTQDQYSQVYNYYNNFTIKLKNQGIKVWTPINSSNTICFNGKGDSFSRVFPAAGIEILNPNNTQDARMIAQDFPNISVGKTIIILNYGYFSGD